MSETGEKIVKSRMGGNSFLLHAQSPLVPRLSLVSQVARRFCALEACG